MTSLRIAVAGLAASLALAPLAAAQYQGAAPLTFDDILAWEDTDNQIVDLWGPVLGPVDENEIHLITVQAANDILPLIGDEYDFIGFWMNFQPAPWWPTTGRAATYGPIANDATGLGSFDGTAPDGTFDFHDDYDLAGSKVQGLLFFTNINAPGWSSDPAFPVNTLTTGLNISHEYMHRFGIYLPDLLDGRKLQGDPIIDPFDPDPCGDATHWDRHVDGQGSCIGLQDWIGSNPAVLGPSYANGQLVENTDIPNGHFSYLDLYLMGMVTPAEVDAGMSELRYMDDSADCSSPYFGPISDFTIDDIVAAAGPRVPDSSASQKDFRTAWVIIHQPGDPPDDAEKAKLIGMLERQQLFWNYSTLGRSTMSHSLVPAPFADLGNALAGTQGLPQLEGTGLLLGDTPATLSLSNALPFGSTYLVLGVSAIYAPFKQGVLVPSPDVVLAGLPLDATGSLAFGFPWPAGLPSGGVLYWQHWIPDPAGVANFAASNAVSSTIP